MYQILCVHQNSHYDIQPEQGLHSLTALPSSTQPSTFLGNGKEMPLIQAVLDCVERHKFIYVCTYALQMIMVGVKPAV